MKNQTINQPIFNINNSQLNITMTDNIQHRKRITGRTFESFGQFLVNVYARKYNGVFKSKDAYIYSLKKIIKCLGFTDNHFLNADIMQLIQWKHQLPNKSPFKTLPKKYKKDIDSSYEAFLNYGRYQLGLINY